METKVAMITPRYPPNIHGGGEISCKLLVDELRKTEEVDVFTFDKIYPNIKSKVVLNIQAYDHLKGRLDGYNIVHAYNMDLLPSIGKLTRDKNINSFASLNGIVFSPSLATYSHKILSLKYYRNNFFMKDLKQIKGYSTLCEYWRQNWIYDGIDSKKISVITNMLDPKLKIKKRKEHGGINILHVGNFSPTRKQEIIDVIKIFSKIKKQDITLFMIGKGKKEREHLINKYKPANKVKVLGEIDNNKLSEFYSNADIFLHPSSLPKGNDRVIIEAMQHGCVVITHCSNVLSPIVRNGKDGVLVSPFSINDFYLEIEKLISDKKLMNKISEGAKKHIKDVCSPDRIKEKYLKAYKKIW